jgi:hypothetical protein
MSIPIEQPRGWPRGVFDRQEFPPDADSLAKPPESCGECARPCGSNIKSHWHFIVNEDLDQGTHMPAILES